MLLWSFAIIGVLQYNILASQINSESSSASSKTYLLVVPTVAPSNLDQSKRQAVGNVISADKNTNHHFFQFPDGDPQQKQLKRKIPSISPLVGASSRVHYSGRPKDPVTNAVLYPQIPISPPSSTGSSASSSTSNHLTSGALLQNAILSQEVDEQERYDLTKDAGIIQQSAAVEMPPTTSASLEMNVRADNETSQEMVSWVKLDGMESDLVKDFDANLSGLGLELGANAYNMSEVLNLPIFKQEGLVGASQGLPPLQYMLCAPTSPATKVYEETLTYLNQGQSYEIKLKKLRDINDMLSSKLVKSQVRVVFHDRRLQYTEYQQFESWKSNRPGDRLLNIDIPMSVGVHQPQENSKQLNLVEFVWHVEKEASVWIQVHCISTEFTPRKHGGEKGVPFRIQVDTYALSANGKLGRYIHSASCQIKVFKPKGADRKLKTDKDKMEKRSAQDKLKYQPSYDSTLLSECMPNALATEIINDDQNTASIMEQRTEMVPMCSSTVNISNASSLQRKPRNKVNHHNDNMSTNMIATVTKATHHVPHLATISSYSPPSKFDLLHPTASMQQTHEWLERNRFNNYINILSGFTGSDLLALSRDDIIQICGPADGIRLYNALRAKAIHPRLTLYLTSPSQSDDTNIAIYKAFYLEKASVAELVKAVRQCLYDDVTGATQSQISRILYQPRCSNIHVLVTDEVVAQMKDESSFAITLIKHQTMDSFQVILKPQN